MTRSATAPTAPGLDDLMPTYDFRSRHAAVARAPVRDVWVALETFRLAKASPWTRTLLMLRGLSGLGHGTLRGSMYRAGFRFLAERPGEEVIAGIIGRFWAVRRERAALLPPVDARDFFDFDREGFAKGTLSFHLEPLDEGRTRIVTETRVRAIGAAARWRLTAYWLLIRPFGGFLRRDLLRAVARLAEERRGREA